MKKVLTLLLIGFILSSTQNVRAEIISENHLQVVGKIKRCLDNSEKTGNTKITVYYERTPELQGITAMYCKIGSVEELFYKKLEELSVAKEYYIVLTESEYEEILRYSDDTILIAAHIINMDTAENVKVTDEELCTLLKEQYVTFRPIFSEDEKYYILVTVNEYIVAKGDTLSEIAQRFSTDVKDLMKINNIENPDVIYEGQMLIIK